MSDQDDLDSSWQQEDLLAFLQDVDDQIASSSSSTTPPHTLTTQKQNEDVVVRRSVSISSHVSSEEGFCMRPSLLVEDRPLSCLLAEKFPEIPPTSYMKVPG